MLRENKGVVPRRPLCYVFGSSKAMLILMPTNCILIVSYRIYPHVDNRVNQFKLSSVIVPQLLSTSLLLK
jgi:hypothetical protein